MYTNTICLADGEVDMPNTYKQAIARADGEHWQHSVNEEHNGIVKKEVYEWVPWNPKMRVLGTRWVFAIKRRLLDGSIERYKARLYVRGDQQREGVDYDETYAAVIRATTLRLLLSMANAKDMEVHFVDIEQAYLNGVMDDEAPVYVRPPPGGQHAKAKCGGLRKHCTDYDKVGVCSISFLISNSGN
jgi:hypothetical protein